MTYNSGTSLLNKYEDAIVFSFDRSARMKTASLWSIALVVCIYLSWVIYWKELNPYKCALFALESRPICIDEAVPYGNIYIFVFLILVFISFAFLSFWCLISSLAAKNISLDKDGIWPAHIPKKEGLLPWESVEVIKDKPRSQFTLKNEFSLIDKTNERVLSAAHLADVYKLKQCVYDKRPDLIENYDVKKPIYKQSKMRSALDLFLVLYTATMLFILIAMPVEELEMQMVFLLFVFIFILGFQAFYRPIKVELADEELILTYCFNTVKISYEKIKSVDLTSVSGISLSFLNKNKNIDIDCKIFKAKPEVLRSHIMSRI
tara:strand:+ start:32 stop:988 length:957 start_codon:yes stop_codon:yes gene_type:complete